MECGKSWTLTRRETKIQTFFWSSLHATWSQVLRNVVCSTKRSWSINFMSQFTKTHPSKNCTSCSQTLRITTIVADANCRQPLQDWNAWRLNDQGALNRIVLWRHVLYMNNDRNETRLQTTITRLERLTPERPRCPTIALYYDGTCCTWTTIEMKPIYRQPLQDWNAWRLNDQGALNRIVLWRHVLHMNIDRNETHLQIITTRLTATLDA
jgi:hypothetical protein